MKKSDLINLIIAYLEKRLMLDERCRQGPTHESKFFEFRGDFPQLSNKKIDPTSLKAERIRGIVFTPEQKKAAQIFAQLCLRDQKVVLLHPIASKRHNPSTGAPYTHKDCSALLGLSFDIYETIRKKSLDWLVEAFKKNATY